MSSEGGGAGASMGGGVDWKTLFLGSCTLIVILGGAAFRAWDSANQRSSHDANESIQSLERRLSILETSAIEYRFQIAQLQQEHRDFKQGHDAQNKAIYNIEHGYLQMERKR